ncbi:MAG: DUF983 domain-containing protein [Janthinobacterium lividum]
MNLTEFDSGDRPASTVTLVSGAIAMAAVSWVEFRPNPLAWVPLVIWPTVTIPAAILLMRPLKAAPIEQFLYHRAVEMGQ